MCIRDSVQEDLADLGAIPMDRGDEEVAGTIVAELHDDLGEVGLPGRDAGLLQRLVETDLLGHHRLDLDHLVAGDAGAVVVDVLVVEGLSLIHI